jgi:hypothetical protein
VDLRSIAATLAVVAVLSLLIGSGILYVAYRKLRHIRIGKESDFFTTLRAVPLSLVIGLDVLDLGLDVFSTPITWFILDRLHLKALRNIATIKAAIPVGDLIPALTLAWFAARYFNLGRPHDPHLIETRQIAPNTYAPRPPHA